MVQPGYKKFSLLFVIVCCVTNLIAQDGSFDSSFNHTGIVSVPSLGLVALKVQSDGKIIMAGANKIKRYNQDGTPDVSFGVNGTDSITDGISLVNIRTMAILPDNRIVLFGGSAYSDSMYHHSNLILRRLANGGPDNSMNGNGFARPFIEDSITFHKMLAQADNKIVLGGFKENVTAFIVSRFNADGTPDNSFGNAGSVTTGFGEVSYLADMTLQADGKIIAVGTTFTDYNGFNADSLAMVRYNPDGSLDKSFNGTGKLSYSEPHDLYAGNGSEGSAVVLQPDGKIVTGGIYGYSQSHGRWFFTSAQVWRFNADGAADSSFNGNGRQIFNLTNSTSAIVGIGLQCDGKIVLGGHTGTVDFMRAHIATARVNQNGSVDSTYGTNGISEYQPANENDYPWSTQALGIALYNDRLYVASNGLDETLAFKLAKVIDSSAVQVSNTCFGDTALFTLINAGVDSVKWIFGDGETFTQHIPSNFSIKHWYKTTGSYRISCLRYTACGLNQLYKTVFIAAGTGGLFEGRDTSACSGESITLQSPVAGEYYQWNTGDTAAAIVVSQPGDYSLSVSSQGCKITDSIFVSFKKVPVINLGNDTSICKGSVITLAIDTPYTTIAWNDQFALPVRTLGAAGTYSVLVTLDGCSNADTISIQEKALPQFYLGADTSLCNGTPFTLQPVITADSYSWQDGSVAVPRTVSTAGLYRLTATNTCGSFTDEINIAYHGCDTWLPSAFTPNKDGLNDLFRLKDAGQLREFTLQIYNRLGKLVFTTADAGQGWDGSLQGVQQPVGNYIWKLHYKNSNGEVKDANGSVLLIR